MKKNVLRFGLPALALLLILTVTGSTFAVEVARRPGWGPPPPRHYYGPHYGPHFGPPPPPPVYRPYYRPYYRPVRPIVPYYAPGFQVVTPRASVGVYF